MSLEIRSANLQLIKIGELQEKWSANGDRILRYYIDFWHNELKLHKELSAPEIYLLQGKVDALMVDWDRKLDELRRKQQIRNGKDLADQMTWEAAERLSALSFLLQTALVRDPRINWETLKDYKPFNGNPVFLERLPDVRSLPAPIYIEPSISFLDRLLGRKTQKLKEAALRHKQATERWEAEFARANEEHSRAVSAWEARKAQHDAAYLEAKASYEATQDVANAKIDALADSVKQGHAEAVIEHETMVLDASDYGDLIAGSFELDYLPDTKTLLIHYELPSPDAMPKLKSARFISATGEIRETYISERDQKANYDSVCYQICLRTIHEVLTADEAHNIERVLFNGFATFVSPMTGQDTTSCIMSILVGRSEFSAIDLSRVDPKACFKSLKGVSASSLSALAPVPPVMEMNKEDRRFVAARNAIDGIDASMNLAAMDWEDFEHLVRELFEKEFASRGGEVKITQSSSDGGVDAVAFDPDPITGGKIVIQAKRYTRTVGVSAVRDLFGTMQHEGASRGVLITTADYGPDAHRFAAGKPITLFTGSNLLYLLDKHGYRAKIDIREARSDLGLRSR